MTGNTFKYGMYVAHFYWVGRHPGHAVPRHLHDAVLLLRPHQVRAGLPEAALRREDAGAQRDRLRGDDPAGVGHQPVRDGAGAAHLPGLGLGRQHVGLGGHRRRLRHPRRPDVGDLHRDHPVLPHLVRPVPGVGVRHHRDRRPAGDLRPRPRRVRDAVVDVRRSDPERHADHLGRHRPRPRLRALVRLLDHRLPRRPAGLLGQGPARRPA